MAQRLVIDPITRIEGHLRIEAEVGADNKIAAAYSSGTMVRGMEIILRGRDPREAWAFAQRACGVCTTVHAFASIRSVEDALKIKIPNAANLIRNLMIAQQYVHDHVMHFYHLHALDWVDVVAALKADPQKTSEIQQSISPWPNVIAGLLRQRAGQGAGDRGQRPALDLRQRLLGPPGLQAAAGDQPAGGGALPGGAGLAEGCRQDPHDFRRQEPAPELRGGRRAHAD